MVRSQAGLSLSGIALSLAVAVLAACAGEVERAPTEQPSGAVEKPAVTAEVQSAEAPAAPAEAPAKPAEAPAQPAEAAAKAPAAGPSAVLLRPAEAAETAPDAFRARFQTTKGDFVVEVTRAWAPHGADRFYSLVKHGYFTDVAFFRVVPKFVAQFGMHGDERVRSAWRHQTFQDDPVTQSNRRGTVTFAQSGNPNSRTTQLFINLVDNPRLDTYGQGFPPIGQVVEGLAVVDMLDGRYGDAPPGGRGPDQGMIDARGNDYLRKSFPALDYIVSAAIVE